jgi:hypothetical protein
MRYKKIIEYTVFLYYLFVGVTLLIYTLLFMLLFNMMPYELRFYFYRRIMMQRNRIQFANDSRDEEIKKIVMQSLEKYEQMGYIVAKIA